ncbi:MAG TPA: response regulator transcription factor [Longilinea sp.]|nr:response regulator transcription factor [Longilinea sp.]
MVEKKRVLVVDDEQIARLTLERMLQVGGYEVVTVGSGEEAIAELNADHFDVMLLDLNLPGMSGLDVLSNSFTAAPDLKVIVLTAFGSMDSAIKALRFRVHDYLVKPVKKEQVLASINEAIETRSLIANQVVESKATYATASDRRSIYQIGDGAVIDCNRRVITWNTVSIHLTPTEAKLFRAFVDAPGIVLSPSELVSFSHGYKTNQFEAARILRPVFSRLRGKLEPIPGAEEWIRNVRGSGYVFEAEVTKL